MNLSVSVRRWLLGWVLIALLGAQALGHMHRVVHAHGAPAADAHAQEWAAPEAAAGAPGAGWIGALFAGHERYSGCLSFDAVGHDGMAPPATLATPVLAALPAGVPHPRAGVAGCASAPFQARAPPLSR